MSPKQLWAGATPARHVRYKPFMDRQITCECCKTTVAATTGNQRVCPADKCRKWLRAETRKKRYYEQRPTPICVWCEEPIHEPRRREYHAECRADKNRERVRAYNELSPPRKVPKKPRTFKGTLTCEVCKEEVQRTGARQIICKKKSCINKKKQERKKRRREEKRELEELRAKKEAKARNWKPRKQPEFVPDVYRVSI